MNDGSWNDEKQAALDKWASESHSDYMAKFEALCKDGGKFTQDGDTIGELFLFGNLFMMKQCGFLKELPLKLTKFYDRLMKVPAVKNCCEDKTKLVPNYFVPIPEKGASSGTAPAAAS